MNRTGVILFAHGSREPDWARPFEQLRDLVAQKLGAKQVELAFLEIMAPTLTEAVARLHTAGAGQITIVPVFLAAGGHLKRDLPRMLKKLRSEYPDVSLNATPPLGEIDSILDSIAGWIVKERTAG